MCLSQQKHNLVEICKWLFLYLICYSFSVAAAEQEEQADICLPSKDREFEKTDRHERIYFSRVCSHIFRIEKD